MQNTNDPVIKESRDNRLDLIKAVCILLVLAWHLQPIDISAPRLQTYQFNLILKESLIFFYFQITLLAVPTFIIVSLYLYFKRLAQTGNQYTLKRLQNLALIYTFWLCCQIVVFYIVTIPKTILLGEQWELLKRNLSLHILFPTGGPSLPIVQSSVFYYLAILIELTILGSVFSQIAKVNWMGIFAGILIISVSLVYFEICSLNGVDVSFLNVRTFLIYVPIAYYFRHFEEKFSASLFLLLMIGYIMFSFQDYFLRIQQIPFNVYLRPAVVFGSSALFYGIKNIKSISEIKIVKFLSVYSLGIYALHKYFQYLSTITLTPYFKAFGITKKVTFGYFRVNIQVILIALSTTILVILCILLLERTPLRKFIR